MWQFNNVTVSSDHNKSDMEYKNTPLSHKKETLLSLSMVIITTPLELHSLIDWFILSFISHRQRRQILHFFERPYPFSLAFWIWIDFSLGEEIFNFAKLQLHTACYPTKHKDRFNCLHVHWGSKFLNHTWQIILSKIMVKHYHCYT